MKLSDKQQIEFSALDFPVDGLIPYLQPIREKYTKDGKAGMLPHITILYPFFTSIDKIENNKDRIIKLCKKIEPFTAKIERLKYFPNNNVMFYDPEPQLKFQKIIKLFSNEFIETPLYNGAFPIDRIKAHITVCTKKQNNKNVENEVSEIMRSIIPFSFEVNQIRLHIKVKGKWTEYYRFQL